MDESQSREAQGGGGPGGWVSWTGDSWTELPPEQRNVVRRTMVERHRARGPLMAVVQVRVYENGTEPQLSFPRGCTLGVDTDRETLAGVVARARDALQGWR